MSLRQCPITHRWVVVAAERASRPNEYRTIGQRESAFACPFCRGQEAQTPDAIFAVDREGAPATDRDWQVRVVPNKYPALHAAAALDGPLPPAGFVVQPSRGAQEVVIESPRHIAGTSDLTESEAALVMHVYRERLRAHRAAGKYAQGLVFKNVGPAAGASIEHTHSQIAILPAVPEAMQQVVARGQDAARAGRHLWLDVLQAELAAGERIVAETERLVAFCPFAPRFPYETWIVPRRPEPHFEATSDATVGELGRLTRDLIRRLEKLLDRPAYNYMLFTAPFASSLDASGYLWHLELLPRTATPAGLEWGLGWHVNPVSPETAAAALRQRP